MDLDKEIDKIEDGVRNYYMLTDSERSIVDSEVNLYKEGSKDGINCDAVMAFMQRISPAVIELNEALEKKQRSKSETKNEMRRHLFEDRLKNGYYNNGSKPEDPAQQPVNINVNNETSDNDVKQLKEEIKNINNNVNVIMEFIKSELK